MKMPVITTPVTVALIALGGTLAGIILKYWFDERGRKKERTRGAVKAIHEKLNACEDVMSDVLKNSPPPDDPYNTVRVNASRAAREAFEKTLELEKIHLPKKVVKEAMLVCIRITAVVIAHGTARELRGTPDAKARYEDLRNFTADMQNKMKHLETRFQKLVK
jgi:hypothetical protein